jgi:hypothetical protein
MNKQIGRRSHRAMLLPGQDFDTAIRQMLLEHRSSQVSA